MAPPPLPFERTKRFTVTAVVLYAVAGFFTYTVSLLSFVRMDEVGPKLVILGLFLVPAVVSLAVALRLSPADTRLRRLGIVLLCGGGITVSIVVLLATMQYDPRFRDAYRPETLRILSDFWTGGIFVTTLVLVGALSLYASLRKGRARAQR